MQHKYFFLTLVSFLAVCQTGRALECYECSGECKDMVKKTCAAGQDQCLSGSATINNQKLFEKRCGNSAMCNMEVPLPNGQTAKANCCATNLCNSAYTNVISLGTAVLLLLVSLYLSQF